jgi:DNA-binding transcriptional LysR family regulator
MKLEQLRVFVAVAEVGHVTRAARSLGMTQSAASAAIAALEGRYGAILFHRVGRGIELSETGRRFLPEGPMGQTSRVRLCAGLDMTFGVTLAGMLPT